MGIWASLSKKTTSSNDCASYLTAQIASKLSSSIEHLKDNGLAWLEVRQAGKAQEIAWFAV